MSTAISSAGIGHNMPPKTPFEASRDRINELFDEAKNWLDGDPIESQENADAVQKLLREIQQAAKEADAARRAEAKPFDDGKAEVQARYNPLIQKGKGLADMAAASCKQALAPWLRKIDEENRRKADEARAEAEAKQRAAMEAMQSRNGDLEKAAEAERLVAEAKQAEADAKKAANAKAAAKGAGKAVTLRDKYTAEITGYAEFARFVWTEYPEDMRAFLDGFAKRIVDAGRRDAPGLTVHHERIAQ